MGHETPTNVEGIKAATGAGFRKHIDDYPHDIIAIPIAYPEMKRYVIYETNELTSVCPLSGLPDMYKTSIEYYPDELVAELKTLKFYFMAYRDVGILHEDLVVQIGKDFIEKVHPLWCRITLKANVRGGIDTIVVYEEGDKRLILGV